MYGIFLLATFVAGAVSAKVGPAPSPVLPMDCVGGSTKVIPGSFCRSYEKCRGAGDICVKSCAENYLYHSKADFPGCDQLWRSAKDCDLTDLPTCTVEQEVVPYPNSCTLYYRCVGGKRHIEWCENGKVFDPNTGTCGVGGCIEKDCYPF